MAEIIPIRVAQNGGIPDIEAVGVAASAGGDTYKNNGETHFFVDNGGASPCVVTFNGITDPNNRTGNTVLTVPAGKVGYVRPLPALLYGQTANITYDQVVSVKVLAAILE